MCSGQLLGHIYLHANTSRYTYYDVRCFFFSPSFAFRFQQRPRRDLDANKLEVLPAGIFDDLSSVGSL